MILLDTGPIIALFEPRDAHHAACRATLEKHRQVLVTTAPILTEAFHILSPESVGSIRLRQFLLAGGAVVRPLDERDLRRAFELMEIYSNLPMDLADASLVVTAERLPTQKIFSLDRRDFSTYRIRFGHQQVAFEFVD